MMAELLTACENGHDHDKDPVKYKMEYLGQECDIGFYCRLKSITKTHHF